MNNIPLIVDLDWTLINADLLHRSLIGAARKNPALIFLYPFWLLHGKGYLKDQLCKRFAIDVTTLPYNQVVIDYIKTRKKNGDLIILATASHKIYAFAIAKYLTIMHAPLFDDVMASHADFNLSSNNKADKLVQRFGNQGFDYMGDHRRDLPVWEASHLSILVNVSEKIIRKTQHLNTLILSKKK